MTDILPALCVLLALAVGVLAAILYDARADLKAVGHHDPWRASLERAKRKLKPPAKHPRPKSKRRKDVTAAKKRRGGGK